MLTKKDYEFCYNFYKEYRINAGYGYKFMFELFLSEYKKYMKAKRK